MAGVLPRTSPWRPARSLNAPSVTPKSQSSLDFHIAASRQSILEVLRTRPLTAPAPGSDRRLSGEARQVGSHSHGSLAGVPRRRPGSRSAMELQRERAQLHACNQHRVRPPVGDRKQRRAIRPEDRRA